MTTGPTSQCGVCTHFRSPFSAENTRGLEGPFCSAFPDGIPQPVFRNGMDHRQPIDGDHGIRWAPVVGETFPEYAFLPEFLGRGGALPQPVLLAP